MGWMSSLSSASFCVLIASELSIKFDKMSRWMDGAGQGRQVDAMRHLSDGMDVIAVIFLMTHLSDG